MAYSMTRFSHALSSSKGAHSVKRTAIVSGTTFAFGFLSGYHGQVKVLNVPVDLGVGVLCQLGAYSGIGGHGKTLQAVGDGALASYFATLGAGMGDKYRRTKGR